MSLEEKLLALVASVTWDGGDQLIRALRPMLAEVAPFDCGEVALARPIGHERWALTDDEAPLASEDLLLRLEEEPLRIDDLPQALPFPRTHARMAGAGLRSLLALPLSPGDGPIGAVVLAHRDGWAFAAASLHTLAPLARMTGLCIERAVVLTALRKEVETLRLRTRKG
ncbi:MAG: hypothetical protein ACHQNV_00290 [Vicinamibacteria bacterium]